MSILNCLTHNLVPSFINSVIKGDPVDPDYKHEHIPELNLMKIEFDRNRNLSLEGILFIRGVEFCEDNKPKYSLVLSKIDTGEEVYEFLLSSKSRPKTSKEYYQGNFVNYDYSVFYTENLNLTEVYGVYRLGIKVQICSIKEVVFPEIDSPLEFDNKDGILFVNKSGHIAFYNTSE